MNHAILIAALSAGVALGLWLSPEPAETAHVSVPLPRNACLQHGGVGSVYEEIGGTVIAVCRNGERED